MKPSAHPVLAAMLALLLSACGGTQNTRWDSDGTGGGASQGNMGNWGGGGGAVNTGGAPNVMEECRADAYPNTNCGVCMESLCADPCAACQALDACKSWLTCAMACSSSACMQGCTQQYPEGEAPALAWYGSDGCLGLGCGVSCSGPGPGICASGVSTAHPACDQCLGGQCCGELNACLASAACADCLANNGPDKCYADPQFAAFAECWGYHCWEPCGAMGCGQTTNGENPPCDECITANCCGQGVACAAGPDANHNAASDCLEVEDCIQSCAQGDTACQDACRASLPEGAALASAFSDCLSQNCAAQCP